MTKDTGGTAFPMPGMIPDLGLYAEPGMTLRDWFAGQALAGLIIKNGEPTEYCTAVETAYRCADYMIKTRNRKEEN